MAKGEQMANEKIDLTEKKTVTNEKPKQDLRYQRDRDREMVRGIFRYYEVPGGSMSFVIKLYKQDQVERFDLLDGQVYTIPVGVAKHLNKNGWYPVHKYAVDEVGKPIMSIGQKVRRFGFQSLEFTEIDDLMIGDKQIITVEQIVR